MSRRAKWVKLAQELLSALPERPDNTDYDDERVGWALWETLERFVTAATLRPEGVTAKVSKDWPRVLADVPVTGWVDQEFIAAVAGVDVRTVRNWERRGMPSFGSGKSKRYPAPHAPCWAIGYHLRRRREGTRVEHLSMELAFAEAGLQGAEIAAGATFRRY